MKNTGKELDEIVLEIREFKENFELALNIAGGATDNDIQLPNEKQDQALEALLVARKKADSALDKLTSIVDDLGNGVSIEGIRIPDIAATMQKLIDDEQEDN